MPLLRVQMIHLGDQTCNTVLYRIECVWRSCKFYCDQQYSSCCILSLSFCHMLTLDPRGQGLVIQGLDRLSLTCLGVFGRFPFWAWYFSCFSRETVWRPSLSFDRRFVRRASWSSPNSTFITSTGFTARKARSQERQTERHKFPAIILEIWSFFWGIRLDNFHKFVGIFLFFKLLVVFWTVN